jgi:glycosyltransferase involved in cell wall biosynthesis
MRILLLSNTPFLPPSAGNRVRIASMVAYLTAAGHDVAMLMLPDDSRSEWDVQGMQARLAWFEIASSAEATRPNAVERARARLVRTAQRIVGGDAPPIGVDDWCPAWFRARARECVRAWRPDVVLVEYVFLSACLVDIDAGLRCVGVIDTHDLMHRRRSVYRSLGMPPQWFHTTPEEERRGLLRAGLVLAMQEEEAAALRALAPERPVLVVPHAQELRPAPPDAARRGRLLFVASHNDLNVRGLAWLTEAVWPALQAAVPGLELVICGEIAGKLAGLPTGVVARGFVAALDAEYAASRVVVCPTPGGTGLNVKSVDALCHGRPVVATRAAAVGLDVGEENGVVVADDPEAFARAVGALLLDDARWHRALGGATAQAERRFDPDAVFGPLVAELERQLARSTSA